MKKKLIIYVEGGNVQGVRTSLDLANVDVSVFDVDNMVAEGMSKDRVYKKWDKVCEGTMGRY